MKAKWVEGRFSSSALNLGIVTMTAGWATTRPSGYVWSAGTHSDGKRHGTMREAQESAETWARETLTEALARLPEVES